MWNYAGLINEAKSRIEWRERVVEMHDLLERAEVIRAEVFGYSGDRVEDHRRAKAEQEFHIARIKRAVAYLRRRENRGGKSMPKESCYICLRVVWGFDSHNNQINYLTDPTGTARYSWGKPTAAEYAEDGGWLRRTYSRAASDESSFDFNGDNGYFVAECEYANGMATPMRHVDHEYSLVLRERER